MRGKTPLALLVGTALAVLLLPIVVEAQGRRSGRGPSGRTVVVVGGYYRPFFDVYPWYPYPYPWFPYQGAVLPPYGVYGYGLVEATSVRLQVVPQQAEVFVDGYLAGTVDDFDGFFQRLRVAPGAHQIVLYLDGYRAVHQDLQLTPGGSYKIRYTMVPLSPGEVGEPRPVPIVAPQVPPPGRVPGTAVSPSRFGTLAIRVQPSDAEVLIDDETWRSPDGQERLVVQVAEGAHRIQVRKDGYDQFVTEVQARAGETENLNVSLPPVERR